MSSINNTINHKANLFANQADHIVSALSLLPANDRMDVLKKIFTEFIPEQTLNAMCAEKTKKPFLATKICRKVLEELSLNELQANLETKTAHHFLQSLNPEQKMLFTIELGKALGGPKTLKSSKLKAGKKYLENYFNPSSKAPINRKIIQDVIKSEEGKNAATASSSITISGYIRTIVTTASVCLLFYLYHKP